MAPSTISRDSRRPSRSTEERAEPALANTSACKCTGAASEIVFREPGPGACAAARATIAEQRTRAESLADKQERSFGVAEADLEESVRTSICARVGRYVWMNGAFAIAKDRPTGPLSAPPK
jgi:hypothetical protein